MDQRIDYIPDSMRNIYEGFNYCPGVRAGQMLYIAGQVGIDEKLEVIAGKEAQFTKAFENVKVVLDEAEANFDDVVELVTYHTDMRDLELFIQVKNRYFTGRFPAWTGVGITSLAMPGLFVEIKCTAFLSG